MEKAVPPASQEQDVNYVNYIVNREKVIVYSYFFNF